MVKDFIKFIHEISGHCGRVIMYLIIKNLYYVRKIKKYIEEVCIECEICAINKERNVKNFTNTNIKSGAYLK